MSESQVSPQDPHQDVSDLERKSLLLETINHFALRLLAIPTKSDLVWFVAREVVGRLGFDDCVIYLVDPARRLLRQEAAIGVKNPQSDQIINALEIPIGEGITGSVAETKQSLIIDDLGQDDRYIPDVEPALSEICGPLIIDDEVVGVIDCEDPRPRFFNASHLETLTMIAAMTSAKLKIILEAQRIDEQAETLQRLNDRLQNEIEERKQIETALQESEQRYRQLVDGSVQGILVHQGERVVYANDTVAKMYGYARADMIWMEIKELIALPEDPKIAAFRRDAVVGNMELRGRRSDGSLFWLEGYAQNIVWNGAPARQNTLVDIDARKRDLQALERSEDRLQQAVELAGLGHWIWDAVEDRCVYCSEEHARIHGVSPAEYMARASDLDGTMPLTHPDDREAYRAALKALRRGARFDMAYRVVTPDGEARHVREIARPIFDEHGEVVQEVGTIMDITEMERAEEQLRQAQKMEAVGQLTGGVAHDFNNLLAVIQGNAELLAEEVAVDDTRCQAILRASARGAALTQRLLAFSRQQPLQPQAIDLGALMTGLTELLRRTLGETIEIAMVSEPDLWRASVDPGQVENAVLNLAINARDAMPGGGQIRFHCRNVCLDESYVMQNPETAAGDYVVLAVSDTGAGMSAEVQAHAFEPFYTTKEVGEGSGLGLSMVYGFAKQSGGHVVICSEPGQGTMVNLYLPRTMSESLVTGGETRSFVPRGRGERILLIEDDAEVRTLAVRMLEGLDYRVIAVPTAAGARAVLANGEQVQLLLSDVVLSGGMSGPEFAEEAMGHDPDLKIIFMSGYAAEAATGKRVMDSGAVLLTKPFRRSQLAVALRQALD